MIKYLNLTHFRNYDERVFEFGETTVIIGNNGVGKTSILEAVSMLSLTTSWKTEKDSEVVTWGQPFTRVVSEDLEMELVIQTHPYMKRVRIGGVSKRTYQVIGHFPTILFQPDDLQLLCGAPTFRRHYLDRVVSQTSPLYTRAVMQLNQVLRQRNRLLKHIQDGQATEDELSFWDQQLADLQEPIQKERVEFIDFLQKRIPSLFKEMVSEGGEISLHYVMSPHSHEYSFLEHLRRSRVKEVAAGVTLYGPHREDISVKWGEHLVEQSMSRGQLRALLVAFKIAELAFITEKTETKPVLLLDDIFSELDAERRQRLFRLFGEYQVIMTATELDTVQEVLKRDISLIDLD